MLISDVRSDNALLFIKKKYMKNCLVYQTYDFIELFTFLLLLLFVFYFDSTSGLQFVREQYETVHKLPK